MSKHHGLGTRNQRPWPGTIRSAFCRMYARFCFCSVGYFELVAHRFSSFRSSSLSMMSPARLSYSNPATCHTHATTLAVEYCVVDEYHNVVVSVPDASLQRDARTELQWLRLACCVKCTKHATLPSRRRGSDRAAGGSRRRGRLAMR